MGYSVYTLLSEEDARRVKIALATIGIEDRPDNLWKLGFTGPVFKSDRLSYTSLADGMTVVGFNYGSNFTTPHALMAWIVLKLGQQRYSLDYESIEADSVFWWKRTDLPWRRRLTRWTMRKELAVLDQQLERLEQNWK